MECIFKKLRSYFFAVTLLFFPVLINAQETAKESVEQAISTWDFLSENIRLGALTEKTDNGQTIATGNIAAFNQAASIEVTLNTAKKIEQIAVNFPQAVQLDLQTLRSISGKDIKSIIPAEMGAAIRTERMEFDFQGKEVTAARIRFVAETWAPFQGQDLKLSKLALTMGVLNPKGAKAIELKIEGNLLLPKELGDYIDFGETSLSVVGYVNSETGNMSLGAHLSSDEIPLHKDKVVVLKEAKIELYLEEGIPGLALGGQVEIRPLNQKPILLDGELAIDLSGEIFGQGFMTGYWHDPMGLSDQLYIQKAGVGFGMDFKTTPFPMPIFAVQGGFTVGSELKDKARFSGEATVAFHGSDPTKNMVDGKIDKANLNDIVSTFYPPGVPKDMSDVFKKIYFRNARLTIVPPGSGIEIFDQFYEPGIHIQGIYDVDQLTGAMLISINEEELTAYASITPVNYKGFSFTSSSNPEEGPEAFIQVRKTNSTIPVEGFFAIDGRIEALDIVADADVYMSDAGFNLELEGKIFEEFQVKLDIAGTDLFKEGSIYVKAYMRDDDNLLQKISEEASNQIGKLADDIHKNFENDKKNLEALRPQLNQKKIELERQQNIVKADYERLCGLLNQKKANEAAKQAKQNEINAKQKEIDQLEARINNEGYKAANFIKKTACPSGSTFYPLVQGGTCWTCPSGYSKAGIEDIDGSRACWIPAKEVFSKAKDVGSFSVFSPCKGGQFADIATGRCYTCPSGYRQVTTEHANSSKKCVKTVAAQYASANKTGNQSCGGNSFKDPRNGGECWECPSGYIRPTVSFNPVNGNKACELPNLGSLIDQLAAKKRERDLLQIDLDVLIKGIGSLAADLSAVSSDICNKTKDTDAINLDPRVAGVFSEWAALSLQVNELQDIVSAVQDASNNTLRAGQWLVKNGGEALGIVDIDEASFEGCISSVNGGKVALSIKGKFADQDISGSFDFDFNSPEEGIRLLANQLLLTNFPKSTRSNGSCTRPNVPRPNIEGTSIEALKFEAKKNPNIEKQPMAKVEERPKWAGTPRFSNSREPEWLTNGSDQIGIVNNGNTNSSAGTIASTKTSEEWFTEGKTALQEQDYENAYQKLMKVSDKRYAEDISSLSMDLLSYDFKKAFLLNEHSIKLGGINGLMAYAGAFRRGTVVEQDFDKSYDLYLKAVNSGIKKGNLGLAYAYFDGLGKEVDYDKAIEFIAKSGSDFHLYKYGLKNWTEASSSEIQEWNRLAAEAYSKGEYVAAADLYKKGADAGDMEAEFNLGLLYYKNQGVRYKEGYSLEPAIERLERAALKGHVQAMEFVADIHIQADNPKKYEHKAIYWYRKAAQLGSQSAKNKLQKLNGEVVNTTSNSSTLQLKRNYNSNFGKMTITQNGNKISGTYDFEDGKFEGTLSGNVVQGKWTQTGISGLLEITFTNDAKSFTCKWRYDTSTTWYNNWTGTAE